MKRRLRRAAVLVAAVILGIVLLPFLAPRALGVWRPDIIFRIPTEQKTIFLTIDDAPTEATPIILDVLKRHEVRATFFIISGRIHSAEQVDAILAAGHSIGHHMVSTRPGWKLSQKEFAQEFDACADVLRSHGEVRFFRPPSGYATKAQVAYAQSKGMKAILGSGYPFDASIEDMGVLVRLTSWLCIDGGIVILHDGKERGLRTAQILDRLIPILKSRDYRFGELKEALRDPPSTRSVARGRSGVYLSDGE